MEKIFLGEQTVAQLVQKFPASYGIQVTAITGKFNPHKIMPEQRMTTENLCIFTFSLHSIYHHNSRNFKTKPNYRAIYNLSCENYVHVD